MPLCHSPACPHACFSPVNAWNVPAFADRPRSHWLPPKWLQGWGKPPHPKPRASLSLHACRDNLDVSIQMSSIHMTKLEMSSIHIPKSSKLLKDYELISFVEAFSQRSRFLAEARFLRTSLISCKQYLPCFSVALRKLASIVLVRASASCAPECTQCRLIPSANTSLIHLASNCVRNSWQFGVAVRVVRS